MVAAVRGTTFTVEADTEKTVVSVTEGTVSVTPKNNNTEIQKRLQRLQMGTR
jgi:ferric-dicitrate binding protein FerR (iron transport regulator)